MVVEVAEAFDYREEDTTFIAVNEDELVAISVNESMCSKYYQQTADRDTSISPRDTLEELRQANNSILNITCDDDDEDDDEEEDDYEDEESDYESDKPRPTLFRAETPCSNRAPAVNITPSNTNTNTNTVTSGLCCRPTTGSNDFIQWFDTSTNSLQNMSETFTERLCSAHIDEPACLVLQEFVSNEELQRNIQNDFLTFLSCQNTITQDELDVFAAIFCNHISTTQPPHTKSNAAQTATNKVNRIHRIRKEYSKSRQQQYHQPINFTRNKSLDCSMLNKSTYSNTQSNTNDMSFHSAIMSSVFGADHENGIDDDLVQKIGKGIEPIDKIDGYDSDPEINTSYMPSLDDSILSSSSSSSSSSFTPQRDAINESMIEQEDIHTMVQDTLNFSWNLTWHPTLSAYSALQDEPVYQEPQQVKFWMERGTILGFGDRVVEPHFMFRTDHLSKPWKLRMLNAVRIVAPATEIDRNIYPFARTSHSIIIKTVHGEELLFEAPTPEDRESILVRWKVVVSRMATLAVIEDMNSMADEFFQPMTSDGITFAN